MSGKRARSPLFSKNEASEESSSKPGSDLLNELSDVLETIKSVPSSGEISAETMETFKVLMLEINRLSSDDTNHDAKRIKQESDSCLELWFDELLAKCEDDGQLDLQDFVDQSDNEERTAVAAAASAIEDDTEDEDDELIIVDDDDIGVSSRVLAM